MHVFHIIMWDMFIDIDYITLCRMKYWPVTIFQCHTRIWLVGCVVSKYLYTSCNWEIDFKNNLRTSYIGSIKGQVVIWVLKMLSCRCPDEDRWLELREESGVAGTWYMEELISEVTCYVRKNGKVARIIKREGSQIQSFLHHSNKCRDDNIHL